MQDAQPKKPAGSWLTGNVAALSGVSFLSDVHSETILALLPTFMANVLGLSKSLIGVIEGLAAVVPGLLHPASGWLSDRLRRRKPFILGGYALSVVAKSLMALVQSFGHVLAVRLTDRVGKGLRTASRDALLADVAGDRASGRVFGFHRMADTLGAVVGSAMAFALLRLLHGNYRGTFLWAAAFGVASVILVVAGVKEARPPAPARRTQRQAGATAVPPSFRLLLAAYALFSLGNFTYAFFLLRAGQAGISDVTIPLLYLAYNVVYALAAFPAGRLTDAIGVRAALVGTFLLFALTCGAMAYSKAPAAMWAWFALYGLHSASINPTVRAATAQLVPPEARGLGLGLLHGVGAGFSLLASILAGLLWDHVSGRAPFIFGAICAVAAALLLAWVWRWGRAVPASEPESLNGHWR